MFSEKLLMADTRFEPLIFWGIISFVVGGVFPTIFSFVDMCIGSFLYWTAKDMPSFGKAMVGWVQDLSITHVYMIPEKRSWVLFYFSLLCFVIFAVVAVFLLFGKQGGGGGEGGGGGYFWFLEAYPFGVAFWWPSPLVVSIISRRLKYLKRIALFTVNFARLH